MSSTGKVFDQLLRLPPQDAKAVQEVCRETHASFNRVVSLCVKKALPAVRVDLSEGTGRVTNVDPLPEKIAQRLYNQADDDSEAIQLFMAAQVKSVEE